MTSFSGYLSSEFDAFLSSPLWIDQNESPLSVMSALARLDIDPWAEAASLAALSKAAAVTRLSALLGPLPGAPVDKPDREGLCQRVLGLLPAGSPVPRLPAFVVATPSKPRIPARPPTSSVLFLGWIVIAALIGATVLPRIIDRPAAPAAAATVAKTGSGFTFDGFTGTKK